MKRIWEKSRDNQRMTKAWATGVLSRTEKLEDNRKSRCGGGPGSQTKSSAFQKQSDSNTARGSNRGGRRWRRAAEKKSKSVGKRRRKTAASRRETTTKESSPPPLTDATPYVSDMQTWDVAAQTARRPTRSTAALTGSSGPSPDARLSHLGFDTGRRQKLNQQRRKQRKRLRRFTHLRTAWIGRIFERHLLKAIFIGNYADNCARPFIDDAPEKCSSIHFT